jgi:hypothetical protein
MATRPSGGGSIRKPTDENQETSDQLHPPVFPDIAKWQKDKVAPGRLSQSTIRTSGKGAK